MKRTDVLDAYESWADKYDNDVRRNPATVAERNQLIFYLAPKKRDVILDLGCGTGRLTIPLSKNCKKIIGIDFSERMLEVARKKSVGYKNIEYRRLDARKRLPFASSSFDSAIASLVINHIDDVGSFFKDIGRVLKSKGTLVFNDVNPDGYVSPSYEDTIFRLSQEGKKIFFHHSLDSLVNNLHRVGFEIEQIKFARVDDRIKPTITRKSFNQNKGRTFGLIIKARKGSISVQ